MKHLLELKAKLIKKDEKAVEILTTNHKADFTNALYNFKLNLQEVNKEEIDFRLLFYIQTTVIFGLYKNEVKEEYFEKILVDKKLKKQLISLDEIINVIDSLNQHTIFYFKKSAILGYFYNYSLCYLFNEILLKAIYSKNKEFYDLKYDFDSLVKKTKRQLKENVKRPKKEDKLFHLLLQFQEQQFKEIKDLTPGLPKSFEYGIGKYVSHPHKLVYQPLINYIKELNQNFLKEDFNETEFYVALYDLLKAISHEKDYFKDDDKIHIKDYYKNNVNNYKSKIARNWFS